MSNNVYIFAGGGTGGHLYPGLAVAEQILKLQPGATIVFACSNRAIDRRILDPLPYAIVPQAVRPVPRSPMQLWPFLKAWVQSARQARDMVHDLKPQAVLGLGGFAAAPLVKQAAKAGIRRGFLNPDAVPGRANQYLARLSQAIFTQFASTTDCFAPAVRDRVRPVGCPVRAAFGGASRDEAIAHFKLRADRKTLLVLGGSLGAASLNDALVALGGDLDALADRWQVLHIAGPEKYAQIAQAHVGRKIAVTCIEYCHRMELAFAAADLALCRGGAGTIAEIYATGTPAVILPYPYHADQQQRLNAQPLVAAGAGLVVEDKVDAAANAAALRTTLLPLMLEDSRLSSARAAAQRIARPHAALDVAQWMVS